jgi:uncharacterized protein
VNDKSEFEITPSKETSSLTLPSVRSGLIARGRLDAEAIAWQGPESIDPLAETRRLAEEGDEHARLKLAGAYRSGDGVAQDYAEAMKWYRKAADAGSGWAAEHIGYLYYDGVGVQQDYAEAVKWLRKGTRSEFGITELCLGRCYLYGLGVQQDYIEAAFWLLEGLQTDAAPYDEIGYLLSRIYPLGEVMEHWRLPAEGQGRMKDFVEDVKWHREHDEAGVNAGQFCLGLAYAYGLGVPRDYGEAVAWFRRAADTGEVWAQLHLAVAYAQGRGVTQDYERAHMWFNVAASRTHGAPQQYAADAREEVASKMTHQLIVEAQRLAREWKPAGANENNNMWPLRMNHPRL